MKKFMIALAFASLGTVAANAQSKYTVATNPFWSNWFVQVGVDMSLANPNQASEWLDNVFPNGKSFGVDVAVGKWFTPGLGLRAKVQWENGLIDSDHQNYKGTYDPMQWVPCYDAGGYGMVAGDVMFNLSNMLCGYNENRVWNFIPYLGAGVLRSFEYQEYTPALRTGIENSFRLGKRVNLFLDIDYTWTTGAFLGGYDFYSPTHEDPASHHGILQAELGLQFNLGKTNWDPAISPAELELLKSQYEAKIRDLEAEIQRLRDENAGLRAEIARLKAENEDLKKKLAGVKPGTDRTIVAGNATSVFFDKNSTEINSEKDLVNLQAVAATAKANDVKVVVTGSADSATGTPEINQRLSEGRADVVADKLVEYGVPASKITKVYKGGVADVEPFNLNRRAVVELK